MLLILVSWIYTTVLALVAGISLKRFIKLNSNDTIITLFLGLFSILIFSGFWAFFWRIHWEFHTVLLLITALLIAKNKSALSCYFKNLKTQFIQLQSFYKILFVVIGVLILAQCATTPILPDNESYYTQTIAWLNQFGFVKGLVNLHLFLGQTSGWHILQSVFNMSFMYSNFNDLSGLCLLYGNYFALTKSNIYHTQPNSRDINLTFGLFPVFNAMFLLFVSSPSPDIAVYVIFFIATYMFIENYYSCDESELIVLVMLSSLLILIKITAILALFFPIILCIKHYVHLKKHIGKISVLYLVTFILLFTKNIIITGNPLYPFIGIDGIKMPWHLPNTIAEYFSTFGNASAYAISAETYANSNVNQLLKHWIFQAGIDGVFNKLMVFIMLCVPFFLKQKAYKIVYILAVMQMVLLFMSSPQFRFYFPYFMVLSLILITKICKKIKLEKPLLIGASCLAIIIAVVPINMGSIQTTGLQFKQIVKPESNSKHPIEYNTKTLKNTTLNMPTHIDFFWGTGNTPVPAINEQQLNYFKTYFNVIPQQRSQRLKDGFYFEKIK